MEFPSSASTSFGDHPDPSSFGTAVVVVVACGVPPEALPSGMMASAFRQTAGRIAVVDADVILAEVSLSVHRSSFHGSYQDLLTMSKKRFGAYFPLCVYIQ